MKRIAVLALAGLVLLELFTGGAAGHLGGAATAHPAVTAENVSVSTTSAFSFVPNQITVMPGARVHLVVTQEANFAHSFVLSSVVNFTIPNGDSPSQLYAFFNAHPPLVNLSIPGTIGAQVSTNFTAPPVGSYEFVCTIPTHFQSGMFGFLDSTTNPGGGSSSSGFPVSPLVLGAIGGAAVVVVVAVLIVRRRSRGTPPQVPRAG
jgi:plastocyanin